MFSEEQLLLKKLVHEFAEKEIIPYCKKRNISVIA